MFLTLGKLGEEVIMALTLGYFLITHVLAFWNNMLFSAFQSFSQITMQHMISISMSSYSVVKQKGGL